jgi:hypothetical protein
VSGNQSKSVKKVKDAKEVFTAVRTINKGIAILLLLRKDLTWNKYILHISEHKLVSGEPKIPSEQDFKDAILALLIVPKVKIVEEGIEKVVESAGLDIEALPDDVKKLVHLIPGIELFIPDKELVEASVGETIIPPEQIMDEVVRIVENMINELGLKGEVKVTGRELYVVISKRVPKKLVQQLERALKARLGDLYEVKVTTG